MQTGVNSILVQKTGVISYILVKMQVEQVPNKPARQGGGLRVLFFLFHTHPLRADEEEKTYLYTHHKFFSLSFDLTISNDHSCTKQIVLERRYPSWSFQTLSCPWLAPMVPSIGSAACPLGRWLSSRWIQWFLTLGPKLGQRSVQFQQQWR